jgi:hypothetical protein
MFLVLWETLQAQKSSLKGPKGSSASCILNLSHRKRLPADQKPEQNQIIIPHEWRKQLPIYSLDSFARAVLTKYHRIGCLNNKNALSRSSGSYKFKIKVSAGWNLWGLWRKGLFQGSLSLACTWLSSLNVSSHHFLSVGIFVPKFPLFYKDISYIGSGPIIITSL